MEKIIAISTNKGGVLKTSITTNLAGIFSHNGKVLIIDADNQGNASLSFGMNPDSFNDTLYDVLVQGARSSEAIYKAYENIDILPSNDDMTFFEFDVLTDPKAYSKPFELMKDALKEIEGAYDYIIIDTPPNLGLMQGNVLSYAEQVLIPFQPENYSMRSLVKILAAIEKFKSKHNKNLKILGVVATMVDSRTTLHSEVLQSCRKFCLENGIKMFDTVIPRSVRFASSIAYHGLPATLTDVHNPLIHSYFELEKEIENTY